MEILITRHGETDWNKEHRLQGKADISLNETGIEQAKQTRDLLKNEQFDLIISSPLKRAKETAEIIKGTRDIEIVYDNGIVERDFGEFEGKTKAEFDYMGFWSYIQNNQYEKAENIREFCNRIYARLDEIKAKYSGKRILIIAHGGVGLAAYCYFNGIPDQDNLLSFVLKNCEVARYIYK